MTISIGKKPRCQGNLATRHITLTKARLPTIVSLAQFFLPAIRNAGRMESTPYPHMFIETPSTFKIRTKIYTDPQIFTDELTKIFEKVWVYVAHESEVGQPGDYRTAYIGRQPVIVTRSEDNGIHVLLNVCRHRGNTICREERGNSSFFRCSYHGWSYKNTGALVGISQRNRYPNDFGKDIEGLVRVPRVAVYRGLIFSSLSETGESFDEYLGGVKRYVDLWADSSPEGKIRVLRPHKLRCAGNWKFHAENGVDGYHPRYVHESAFNARAHVQGYAVRDSSGMQDIGSVRGFDRGHGVLERPGMSQLDTSVFRDYMERLVARYGAERSQEIVGGHNILLFPNVILMDSNIRVIQPISPDTTEVYSYFTALEGVPDYVNKERLKDLQWRLSTTGMISEDDLEIFAANQSALQASGMEWLHLARGIHCEVRLPPDERVGHIADETTQRAIYRAWGRLMNGTGI